MISVAKMANATDRFTSTASPRLRQGFGAAG
jgi:hypothetical protein